MSRPNGEAYAAIYGSAPWHAKFRSIPEQKRLAAFGFWTATLVLCQKERNDGLLPREQAVAVFPCSEVQREHVVTLLIDAGLFDAVGDDIQVHDYADHNRTRAEIEAGRQAMSEGGKRSGDARRKKSSKVASEGTFPGSIEKRESRSEELSDSEPEDAHLCIRCEGSGRKGDGSECGWCKGTGQT